MVAVTLIHVLGKNGFANQSYRSAGGCRYGNVPRGCSIRISPPTFGIQCHFSKSVHHEGTHILSVGSSRCFSKNFEQVKLPIEPEDRLTRPAYITHNEAGYEICENRCGCFCKHFVCFSSNRCIFRLQYLVQKGAILRKGYVRKA